MAQEILRVVPLSKYEIRQGLSGKARDKNNKFWQTRIYTRLVTWGRDFLTVKSYVIQNTLEALGLVPYKKRTPYREAG